MPHAPSRPPPLNVRWTIGAVRKDGFEALNLSVRGLYALLGERAQYYVYVNTIGLDEARTRTGPLPTRIHWRAGSPRPPLELAPHIDASFCEGTAWKLMPIQIDTRVRELALDNDVILWRLPDALRAWLADERPNAALLAADAAPAHGRFAAMAGDEPLNTGLRGTPAGFDLARAIAAVLAESPGPLRSELDEQGLQIAALRRTTALRIVSTADVTICSPFPPHTPEPGRAGAHFVGLNTQDLPWTYFGRPATEVRRLHWEALVPEITRRIEDAEANVSCT